MKSVLSAAAIVAALMSFARSTAAQAYDVRCVGEESGNPCRLRVAPADSLQQIAIRVHVSRGGRPAPSVPLRFGATSGSFANDSVVTDSAGNAEVRWIRVGSAQSAGISVDAAQGGGSLYVEVIPRPAQRLAIAAEMFDGGSQSWFEKNQLPDPIEVRLYRPGPDTLQNRLTAAECAAQRMAFVVGPAAGNITTRDTVSAVSVPVMGGSLCIARTTWVLGAGPGERQIQASLVPGSGFTTKSTPVNVTASARPLPRLISGFAVTEGFDYAVLESGSDSTFHVSRTLPDGSTIEYDSVKAGSQRVDTAGGLEAAVVVGVSAALVPSWHWLTLTAGVDLTSPTKNWYGGISILRVFDVIGRALGEDSRTTEGLPVDLHFMLHVGRRDELENPDECDDGSEECNVNGVTRIRGVGGMITIDAGSLFADLVKALTS